MYCTMEFKEEVFLEPENDLDCLEELQKNNYTKKGTIRKRKFYDVPLIERKRLKLDAKVAAHTLKKTCNEKCGRKCTEMISSLRQEEINNYFWHLDKKQQRAFISDFVKKFGKHRNTTGTKSSRRTYSYKYALEDENCVKKVVCKTFFLATLGFDAKNDRILQSVRDSEFATGEPKEDMRGRHPCNAKINRNVIVEHIKSFLPTISDSKREHASNRLHLPSDISITNMYTYFKQKHPNFNVSYELYRKEVSLMNISCTKVEPTECSHCETYNLHFKDTDDDSHDKLGLNCEQCSVWNKHREKFEAAMQEYRQDGELKVQENENLVVSADLQSVIMLPRADIFKEVVFIPRIAVFNESFVPVGNFTKRTKPVAAIWHEGIAGQKKEDLISTFYTFFLRYRDCQNITIWFDNSAEEHKNWGLYCFFLYAVNCSEVLLETLTLKYFESGHASFMSADSFHRQVELSLKRSSKMFDFWDFKNAVQESNALKVDVAEMTIENFYDWKEFSSKYKLQKVAPKPCLQDMVLVQFERGSKKLWYKTTFHSESIELDFVTAKYIKADIPRGTSRGNCRGITSERKLNILSKLRSIIPTNRLPFWESLKVSDQI